jgi:hypothetical protein
MACSGRGDSILFIVFPATKLAWVRAAPLKPSVRRGNLDGEMKSIVLGMFFVSLAVISESSLATGSGIEQPQKFDEFGDVTCEDEMARLDNFTITVLNNPHSKAYVIVYGGWRGRRNEAKARAARMKFYLVKIRGMEAKRIVTLDGGFRKELMSELWLVQLGDSEPLPTPSVDLKDVRLRGRVRVRGYNCGAGLG